MEHQAFAQLLGNYGEFIGSIAVLATLAYLAIQIRQNTKAEENSALDMSLRNLMAVRQSTFDDPEMSALAYKGLRDLKTLSEVEGYRFRLWLNNVLMSLWHVYAQSSSLRENLWESQTPAILRTITSPGGRAFWDEHRNEFEPSFSAEIDQIIKQNTVPSEYR